MRPRSIRFDRLAVLTVLLATLALGFGSCGDDRPPVSPTAEAEAPCPPEVDMSRAMLTPEEAASLKQRVAGSIVLTGGHLGKHKPCGCTQPQMGGVERLAALYDRLAERAGGNVLGLALGWVLAGNGEPQEEAKAEFIREVFTTLGFRGLLLGDTDMTVPAMTADFGGGGPGTPVPPINVVLGERSDLVGRSSVLDALLRNRRVRVATVLDPAAPAARSLKLQELALEVLGITTAFNQMKPDPDALWIVAARLFEREQYDALRTALKGQGPAIIVDLSGAMWGQEVTEPQPIDKNLSLLVSVDDKGKGAGVLDILVDERGRQSIRYRHYRLRPAYDEMESKSRPLVEETLGFYLDTVSERNYLDTFPTTAPSSEATYVGKFRCIACHQAIYDDYEKTSHAHALGTLEKINYARDPECIRCHVVGWQRLPSAGSVDAWFREPSGFVNPDKTRHLGGVGCEVCHGPGSLHVANPIEYRMFSSKDGITAWKRRCMTCHDADNSPNFVTHEDWYFEMVNHHEVPTDVRTPMKQK
ncbi:MAG: cytochrome c family protein [Planctomycetota bacterium]|nr:cytochrome c family protein [Planctomycetota bacterium]